MLGWWLLSKELDLRWQTEVSSVDELVFVGVSLSLQLSCWESDLTAKLRFPPAVCQERSMSATDDLPDE